MAKIADFVSYVREDGLAKTSHFKVVLNLPSRLNVSPYIEKRSKIIAFCDNTQLPGVSFTSSQVRSYGEFKEVPYEKIYEPITASFYVDNKMIVKNLFDDWMNLVQDTQTRDFNWPDSYITDSVDIIVEDSGGSENYIASLKYCYPKSIQPITLDYGSREIMKINVTFSYKYMTYVRASASDELAGGSLFLKNAIDSSQYTYGYDVGLSDIPAMYFDDFVNFQDAFDNAIDGARTSIVNGVGDMFDILG